MILRNNEILPANLIIPLYFARNDSDNKMPADAKQTPAWRQADARNSFLIIKKKMTARKSDARRQAADANKISDNRSEPIKFPEGKKMIRLFEKIIEQV